MLDLSITGTADKWLRSVEYDFDENNNITKLALASKNGSNTTTYTYGDDNLLSKTTLANGRKVTYTHDAYGRLTRKELDTSTHLVYNYTYMQSQRGTSYTTTKLETESIGSNKYRYTYDVYGNITNIFKVSGNTETILYTYYYDVYNQLTTAIDHENSEKTEYTYNQAGNLTRRKRYTIDYSLNPTATLENISYTYGNSTWKDLLTSYNGQTITYDTIGNPLNYRDGITLTWQNGRELASYSDANYDITYSYGADGMRTKKSIDVLGEIKYVYEGGLLLQMDYLGYVFNFSYDTNGTPIGFNLIAPSGAAMPYYYGINSRGDVVAIYNYAGTLVATYSYDAYGKPTDTTILNTGHTFAANKNPLRYRGYVYDSETGFYYLQSRYYDPVTCRFINADGYCSTGQGITGNNMFAYCNNNPVIYVDNSGCWTIGLNLNANITVILGVSISIGIYFDDNGNFDVQWSYAVPWVNDTASTGVFDAGIGVGLQYMNVDTVDDLCGYSSSTGFSAGDLVYAGIDVLSTSRIAEHDDTIDGIQISGGIGIGVDIHCSNNYTNSILGKQDNVSSNMSSDFIKYYQRHTMNERRTGGKI